MAKPKKIGTAKTMKALGLWHGALKASLETLSIDLSSRQTAILLTVHLDDGPHSVKNLAQSLAISKPAVCRALDVLEKEYFIRRAEDKKDKRNVWIVPTAKGSRYLQEFGTIISQFQKA